MPETVDFYINGVEDALKGFPPKMAPTSPSGCTYRKGYDSGLILKYWKKKPRRENATRHI